MRSKIKFQQPTTMDHQDMEEGSTYSNMCNLLSEDETRSGKESDNESTVEIQIDNQSKGQVMDVAEDEYPVSDEDKTVYEVKSKTIAKLKESTRKIICLLEEIQSKTRHKNRTSSPLLSKFFPPFTNTQEVHSVSNILGANALRKLELRAKKLNVMDIPDEDDDCSVYKKLTRKCHCLNQHEYNDFVIHFNDHIKYFTNTMGELIKNIRIVKKFLYMGGNYTKNALLFLNEGLRESAHSERIEILIGCSHADICNVFEDYSLVTTCISWPCKYENCGDSTTQELATELLYKMARLEEGRRYLKYTSKITNDMKKVLRKQASKLAFEVLESLNATLNLLHPPLPQHVNVTYYCKSIDEGFGNNTMNSLVQYRHNMTLDEIFTYLDLLNNFSGSESGKAEMMTCLPALLSLFKHMVMEYDSSEMNLIVTNILNNVISKTTMQKEQKTETNKVFAVADVATEPIKMKSFANQIPKPKKHDDKKNKSKVGLGLAPHKFRESSKKNVSDWSTPRTLNRSRKFAKELRRSIIVVPIEEKTHT